jgi:hypothetical protein
MLATRSCYWLPENYSRLCSPFSPCITLQWTYHDGHLINLPWAFLVTADVIMICPGQQVPGNCIPLEVRGLKVIIIGPFVLELFSDTFSCSDYTVTFLDHQLIKSPMWRRVRMPPP